MNHHVYLSVHFSSIYFCILFIVFNQRLTHSPKVAHDPGLRSLTRFTILRWHLSQKSPDIILVIGVKKIILKSLSLICTLLLCPTPYNLFTKGFLLTFEGKSCSGMKIIIFFYRGLAAGGRKGPGCKVFS